MDIELRVNTASELAAEQVLTASIPPRMVLVFGCRGLWAEETSVRRLMEDEQVGAEAVRKYCRSELSFAQIGTHQPLRSGWLYVRVEYDGDPVWHEYEVHEDASLREILWGGAPAADVRDPNGSTVYAVLLPWAEVARVAFSDVQWSKQRLEQMEQDEDARNARMMEIKAWSIADSGARSGFSDNVELAVGEERVGIVEFIIKKYGCKYGWCGSLMDPIGEADELCWLLEGVWAEMGFLLESLRTGCSPDDVRAGACAPVDGALDLQDIAVSCYQLGFASAENRKEYGVHLDGALLQKLLGVRERSALRERIDSILSNLENLLGADSYQAALLDYESNTPERVLRGKALILSHAWWLRIPSNQRDKHLDLPSAQGPRKFAHEYLSALLEGTSNAGKVWQAVVDVTDDGDKITKAVAVIERLLATYADVHLIRDVKTIEVIVNRIKTINASTLGAVFTEESWTYEPAIPENYRQVSESAGQATRKFFSKVVGVDESGRPRYACIPGEQITVRRIYLDENRFAALCGKAVDSPFVKRVMGVVEAFNLVHAMVELSKKEQGSMRSWINLLGALCSSLHGYNEIRKAVARPLSAADEVAEGFGRLLGRRVGRALPVVGSAADIVVNAIDARRQFVEHDHDAAAAYGAAAVLLLAALFTGGWLAFGLVAAGAGSTVLGDLLSDPPLVRFAKNGPVRKLDGGSKVDAKAQPYAVIRDRVARNASIVTVDEWASLEDAGQWLYDWLYGLRVEGEPERDFEYRTENYIFSAITWMMVKAVRISYVCAVFLPGVSVVDVFLRIHYGHIGSVDYQDLRPANVAFSYVDARQIRIQCAYALSEEHLQEVRKGAILVMYARIEAGDATGTYVPPNERGTGVARYHAYSVMGTTQMDPALGLADHFIVHERVGTEKSLLDPKYW